jgi:hypothetical protein
LLAFDKLLKIVTLKGAIWQFKTGYSIMRGLWETFKQLHSQKKVKLQVRRETAATVCEKHPLVPKSHKFAHFFWMNLGFWAVPCGLIAMFWLPWYWCILATIGGVMVVKAARESACAFVADTALENKDFYNDMVASRAIRVSYFEQ